MPLAEAFDLLGFFLVELGCPVDGPVIGMQQLVYLGLLGLCVAMLGPLDDKRHRPSRERRHAVPIEAFTVEKNPQDGISEEQHECAGPRGQRARPGECLPSGLAMRPKPELVALVPLGARG